MIRRRTLHNVAAFRSEARRKVPKPIFDFVDGGAEDELTMTANSRDFDAYQLLPRVLVNTGQRRLTTSVCGVELSVPLICAPTGYVGVVHPDGERAAVIAAAALGTRAMVSSAATYSIEELGAIPAAPFWFQLYPPEDKGLAEGLIERATTAGVEVLGVTVDVPAPGKRERDIVNGYTIQPRLTWRGAASVAVRPRWAMRVARNPRIYTKNFADPTETVRYRDAVKLVRRSMTTMSRTVSWDDLSWIRSMWTGKMVVKGILHPDDARRAVDRGVDGIIVSNHGGRQLDGAVSSISALPVIAEAVGNDVDLVLDGGVRRGSHVVKAMCLGARAVMIGRPWVYGLGANGTAGVSGVLDCLVDEIERTLTLAGVSDVADLGHEQLRGPFWT